MKKPNQSGIAHIAIVAIVLIVGIVGVIGWQVMKKNASVKDAPQVSHQDTKKPTVEATTDKEEIKIPADWLWFESKDGEVKFAYPKAWGTLTETDRAYSPGYYADTSNFMRPVTVTKKSDFLIQVRKSFYDPTWYSWSTPDNSLVSAQDEQAPDASERQGYDKPVALGTPRTFEPHLLSGTVKHPIFHELGKGAMNCGERNYFFDIKDSVVHVAATLCDRGGEWEPQAGQQYVDVVETPLRDLYQYIES